MFQWGPQRKLAETKTGGVNKKRKVRHMDTEKIELALLLVFQPPSRLISKTELKFFIIPYTNNLNTGPLG